MLFEDAFADRRRVVGREDAVLLVVADRLRLRIREQGAEVRVGSNIGAVASERAGRLATPAHGGIDLAPKKQVALGGARVGELYGRSGPARTRMAVMLASRLDPFHILRRDAEL